MPLILRPGARGLRRCVTGPPAKRGETWKLAGAWRAFGFDFEEASRPDGDNEAFLPGSRLRCAAWSRVLAYLRQAQKYVPCPPKRSLLITSISDALLWPSRSSTRRLNAVSARSKHKSGGRSLGQGLTIRSPNAGCSKREWAREMIPVTTCELLNSSDARSCRFSFS